MRVSVCDLGAAVAAGPVDGVDVAGEGGDDALGVAAHDVEPAADLRLEWRQRRPPATCRATSGSRRRAGARRRLLVVDIDEQRGVGAGGADRRLVVQPRSSRSHTREVMGKLRELPLYASRADQSVAPQLGDMGDAEIVGVEVGQAELRRRRASCRNRRARGGRVEAARGAPRRGRRRASSRLRIC